ncbi:MAG TPA: hypothetical protein V6C99_03015, partial [Oculatellaceae cyanobacterium]
MFKNPKINLLIILALVIFSVWTIVKDHQNIHLGLDLKGGIRLTLEAQPTEDVPKVTRAVMESLQSVIERRVNGMGIAESVVQRAGDRRLIVEIPGVSDPQEAKARLGKVGKLEFKRLNEKGEWVNTGVSGKDLKRAELQDQNGRWVVAFELTPAGTKKFAQVTSELAPTHAPLGIFLDDEMESAPAVNTPILKGAGVIEGTFTRDEAKKVVDILNAGALPVDIEIVEENTVGPLLGQASIQQSLKAGLIGMGLVMAFMLLYYRKMGFVADIALLVYTVVT